MRRSLRFFSCALFLLSLSALNGCDDEENGQGNGMTSDQDSISDPDTGTDDLGNDLSDASPDLPEDAEGCVSDEDCDDNLFCNGYERCFNGACFESPTSPCSDRIECSTVDCDEEEDACLYEPDDSLCAPGEVCDLKAGCFRPQECFQDEECDDGLTCNGLETCQDNACQPGTPPDCNDGLDCTEDSCVEELSSCQNTPVHSLCLPAELCNLEEGCTPRPPCSTNDDCDDASFCNGVEVCDLDSGECVPGEPPLVDDGVPCTVDTCSDELAMVLNTPNPARCSDGLFCNGAEICHPVDGCQEGEPPVLSDGVGCTTDSCNEELDLVEHTPNHEVCNDGLFCNGDEVCHTVEDCSPGEPPLLNDGVGCTIDSCDEINDTITHTPSDEVCDNNLFCDGTETCHPTNDCQPGTAPTLDDDVSCTNDSCDENNDVVVHAPNHEVCGDGLVCNGIEVCHPTNDCQPGPEPQVDDDIPCTIDACDPETGEITHVPNHALCDNGLFCDGAEICSPTRGCIAGDAPSIDDNVSCTIDACDEINDTITHTPTNSLCDNNLFCDGAETCHPTNDCQPGTAPTLDDNVSCTIDACDEINDVVTHSPSNALCDNDLFCDGTETCHPTNDCQPGTAPTLDDGVSCTNDSCDEETDTITHTPNNALCDNGLFCDGTETCHPTNDCQPGTAPEEGTVCGNDPRQICIEETCQESTCGDGVLDETLGESCDDGDDNNDNACNNNCQPNDANITIPGTYNLLPDLSHSCLIFGSLEVVNFSYTSFLMSVQDGELVVSSRPTGQTPDIRMTGDIPEGNEFTVMQTIPGGEIGCSETYVLTGTFEENGRWVGSFSYSYTGDFCFECAGDNNIPTVIGRKP